MKTVSAFILLLLAAACAFTTFDEELPKYVGRPVDSLVARLGYPSSELTIMGRKVYTWRADTTSTSITPVTTTATGTVGARMTPVTVTGTSYVPTTEHLSCVIRAAVNADNTIASVDYEGNNGACLRYSSRLGSSSGGGTAPELQVITCKFANMAGTYQMARRSCTNNGGTVVSGGG